MPVYTNLSDGDNFQQIASLGSPANIDDFKSTSNAVWVSNVGSSGGSLKIIGENIITFNNAFKSGHVSQIELWDASRAHILARIDGIDASFVTGTDSYVGLGDIINGVNSGTPGDRMYHFFKGVLSGNDTLNGNNSSEHLSGFSGNDVIHGGAGDDIINGDDGISSLAGSDQLYGDAGRDFLYGGKGDDFISGGVGYDTAAYVGNSSEYSIKSSVSDGGLISWSVSDNISDRDGNDTLTGIEALNFFGDGKTVVIQLPDNAKLFGNAAYDASGAGGQVYALYAGILGRAPDIGGLEYYADQIAHGTSPASLAANFLASPEGQARLGAADNTAFVQQLYQNTLHRDADSAGLQYHLDELAHGVSRVDVANSFVFSPEHLISLQPTFDAGLFVPDAQASEVARLYYTMLGRAPDAGGLAYWTDKLDHGGSASDLAQGFLNSPENQATYGKLSNSAYVDALYVNALGRHAEAAGSAFWTSQLDHGTSRADLAVSLSQSAESQTFHLAQIEQGWHLA